MEHEARNIVRMKLTTVVRGSSIDGGNLNVTKDADSGQVEALQMADAKMLKHAIKQ
jgi:hypothetical protein